VTEVNIPITTDAPPVPPYDWRKSVLKGVKAGAVSLGGIAAAGALDALVRALSDQAVVTGLLGQLAGNKTWVLLAVPAIVGAAHAYDNRRKQKKAAASE
jgi:hypothetical protein